MDHDDDDGWLSSEIDEMIIDDMEDMSDEDNALLGLGDHQCDSPMTACLNAYFAQCSPARSVKTRSVVTYEYPGQVFQYMGDQPGNGVSAEHLWCNLGQKREDENYLSYFRMPRKAFDDLLGKLRSQGPGGEGDTGFVGRKDSTRSCVPGTRSYTFKNILAVTLYFLAHCASCSQLSSIFGIPVSSAWTLVGEGVTALVRVLLYGVGGNDPVVKFPETDAEKLAVIGGFQQLIGHLPWCIGAIDGTHIGQRKPDVTIQPAGRDLFYGWKSKVSQLLVWIVDARGRALYFSAGHPGSSSDAGVWARDCLRQRCEQGILSTPKKEVVVHTAGVERRMHIGPYFVGDGAFPLRPYMMKCYGEDNTRAKREFNQAVCDVRKVVEQAIGRLKMCWQFCHKNVWMGDPGFVKRCIEACVALHNFRMDYDLSCDDEIVAAFVRDELEVVAAGGEHDEADATPVTSEGEHVRNMLASWLMNEEG